MDQRQSELSRTTTGELLALQSDVDDSAWEEFSRRYRPILRAVARRQSLGEHDADDVAQESLFRCWKALKAGQYQRKLGRLRDFLVGITRYRAIDKIRSRARDQATERISEVGVADAADDLNAMFDEECRSEALRKAMDELVHHSGFSMQTLKAFERVHFDGLGVAAVADELSVSTQVVYNATHRCTARLEELVARWSDHYFLD